MFHRFFNMYVLFRGEEQTSAAPKGELGTLFVKDLLDFKHFKQGCQN